MLYLNGKTVVRAEMGVVSDTGDRHVKLIMDDKSYVEVLTRHSLTELETKFKEHDVSTGESVNPVRMKKKATGLKRTGTQPKKKKVESDKK